MDFTNKEISLEYFTKNEKTAKAQKNKKRVIRKLKAAFFILLAMSVLTYLFLANNGGRFYSYQTRFIFVAALSVIFVSTYIILSLHLYFDINFKHYLKFYQLYDIVQFLVLVVLIIIFIQMFIFKSASISGPSMEPTLHDKDQVLVKQVNFNFKHDDIVVIDATIYAKRNLSFTTSLMAETNDEFYIKRIRAIPGDKISLEQIDLSTNFAILINNKPLTDVNNLVINLSFGSTYYLNLEKLISDIDGVIPKGMYFLLGDNITNSRDSRTFGLVEEIDILGVVNFRIWKNIGRIK